MRIEGRWRGILMSRTSESEDNKTHCYDCQATSQLMDD